MTVPADLNDLLTRGGRGRIDLLQFAVCSAQPEPLFAFLAGEFRLTPRRDAALTLADVFCDRAAPFRLRCAALLEPSELRLTRSLQPLRVYVQQLADPPLDDDGKPVPPRPPAVRAEMFDFLIAGVLSSPEWRAMADGYDPEKGPHENLPGGAMTPGQRQFVERVWKGVVRPRLVAGGFRLAASLGG